MKYNVGAHMNIQESILEYPRKVKLVERLEMYKQRSFLNIEITVYLTQTLCIFEVKRGRSGSRSSTLNGNGVTYTECGHVISGIPVLSIVMRFNTVITQL